MGFRFRRSQSFGAFRLNFSTSGVGMSVGAGGFRLGLSSNGQLYNTINIPNTGLTYHSNLLRSRNTPQPSNSYQQGINLLGFSIDENKYGNSDGCLTFLLWFIAICLIPFGIGVIMIFFLIRRSRSPKKVVKAHLETAISNFYRGDFEGAVATLDTALYKVPLSPYESDIVDLKGVCLYYLGRYAESSDCFGKALRLNPSSERLKLLYVETLILKDDKTDCPKIIELYEDLLSRKYDERQVLLTGNCYYLCENYDKAISYFQKIPKNSELFLKALQGIANSFIGKNQIDLAIETLKKAPLRTSNPDDDLIDIMFLLGNLYEEKGEKELAKQLYRKVYTHSIEYEDVAQRLQELDT